LRTGYFLLRHSREGGNPETYPPAQHVACFDLQPFGLERTCWIPAFAGMTMNLYLFDTAPSDWKSLYAEIDENASICGVVIGKWAPE
jgi:hypothetical protein